LPAAAAEVWVPFRLRLHLAVKPVTSVGPGVYLLIMCRSWGTHGFKSEYGILGLARRTMRSLAWASADTASQHYSIPMVVKWSRQEYHHNLCEASNPSASFLSRARGRCWRSVLGPCSGNAGIGARWNSNSRPFA